MATSNDGKTYLVVGDYGPHGRAFLDADCRLTDRESLIQQLLGGDPERPIQVVAFDAVRCDVSHEIAQELVARSWRDCQKLPRGTQRFCECSGVGVPEIIEW